MDYKNFLLRIFISLLLLFTYFYAIKSVNLLFLFGSALYLVIFFEIIKNFKENYIRVIFYLLISFVCFSLYLIYYFDKFLFNLLIFVLVFLDSFSYITGVFFGKNFIFSKISPKKSLEGYLGGIFFTNLFYVFYTSLNTKILIEIKHLYFINLIIIFSVIGDLIQSYFKRQNQIKNSSNFLPGHGGFFDRFDSFILSIIFLFTYSIILS